MSTQISAHISNETKAQLEAFVTSRGVTRARLIEDALQHHLQALRDIPEDLIVPSRLVVSEATLTQLVDRIESDDPPTAALRTLMHSGGT